jgi:hypothetical protein
MILFWKHFKPPLKTAGGPCVINTSSSTILNPGDEIKMPTSIGLALDLVIFCSKLNDQDITIQKNL